MPALFILNALLWGFSFVAIRYVLHVLPPVFGAWMRVLTALLTLLLIAKCTGRSWELPRSIRARVWIAGLFLQGIPFALIYWGEQVVAPGLAGLINGTLPLWTFAASLLVMRHLEHFTWHKTFGLICGFGGTYLIFAPYLNMSELDPRFWWGIAALFGMVWCYTIGTLMNRALLAEVKDMNFFGSIIHQHIASALFLMLCTAVVEGGFPFADLFASPQALGATLYLGIGSTAIAWLCYLSLIRSWGAVRASAVTYCVPVIALFTDWLCFGTVQPLTALLGAIIVLASIVLIHRRA